MINTARRRVEAGVNQSWAQFVQTNIQAEDVFADSVRSEVETTDQSESLLVTEISEALTVIRQNASAAISGFIKMDECVDVDAMKISVMYAWKPEFSQVAADANREMERSRNEDGGTFSRQRQRTATESESPQSTRKRSDVDF